MDLREHVGAREPGAATTLTFWRDGEVRSAEVRVGEERYERRMSVGLGLFFNFLEGSIDLWPFDDGIDVLGLVTIKGSDRRYDRVGDGGEYLGKARPGEDVKMPAQETFTFRVIPLSLGWHKSVVGQRAHGQD